jgi:DNA-directed RNA polymerase beta' subunit
MKVMMNKKPENWYEIFKILYNDNFTKYKDCISVKLNRKIMFKYRINIYDIAKIIEDTYDDLSCVFSSEDEGILDIFIDVSNINFPKEKLLFINFDNAHEIYIEEVVYPILEKLVIFGIPGISNIYYTNENDEWFVETDGTNFIKLLGHPIVDMTRLQSNNVWDIYENLGIEAAREYLIEEFISIMTGINPCHARLLVDKMTFAGTIASISRYTLRKDECGPFAKSSFEESVENFVKASINCDVEKTRGLSASIICGKRAEIGTGFFDLKMDIKSLPINLTVPKHLLKGDGNVIEEKSKTKLKTYNNFKK